MLSRTRSRAALVAWSLIVVAAVFVLHASGHGALAAPPLTEPSRWSAWLSDRTPVAAGFAVVRLLAIGAAWELAITTVAGIAARLTGSSRLTIAVDRVTATPLRALISTAFGLSLATTTLAGTAAFAAPSRTSPPVVETMVRVDGRSTETMVRDGWRVRRGDNFWAIARHLRTDSLEREPTNAEIAEYWEQLMAANRDKYRDANLIYPAQEFDVPPPPAG